MPDGSDGFCDLPKLILESMLELPTYIPQITLRWTAKTPKELFSDLTVAYENDNRYNRMKAEDINYLSSLFFQGCIERIT